MKTAEDFETQAQTKNIRRWQIHQCSMCGYPCGYVIAENGVVAYDTGCDCTWGGLRPSSYEEIANYYNSNLRYANDPKNDRAELTMQYVNEMNKFWGFE